MPEPHTFNALGWLLVAITTLVVSVNQIDDFLKRRAGRENDRMVGPQPFEVKAAAEFVHKDTFEDHVSKNTERHGQLFAGIQKVDRDFRELLKSDTDALHDKINDVASATASLEGKTELMNQRLVQMDGKIDRLIERT